MAHPSLEGYTGPDILIFFERAEREQDSPEMTGGAGTAAEADARAAAKPAAKRVIHTRMIFFLWTVILGFEINGETRILV